MRGWLVNDYLTCIPGTKTFWHDLLENIIGLEDHTGEPFGSLAHSIWQRLQTDKPSYIIRNLSYFPPIHTDVPTISLLQDIMQDKTQQIEVGKRSRYVVANSEFVKAQYDDFLDNIVVIPLGVDFDYWCPGPVEAPLPILPNSILFVGAANDYPKGFDQVQALIQTTNYNFCLVMKDEFQMNHPRVRVFNRVNRDTMRTIYRSCRLLLCTSRMETQHLAGIEAAACGLPLVVANVGAYYGRSDWAWGRRIDNDDYLLGIESVMQEKRNFFSREYFRSEFHKENCMDSWRSLIAKVLEN